MNVMLRIVCYFARLELGEVIGQGEFGVVRKGIIKCGSSDAVVAVKTLKGIWLGAVAIMDI